MNYTQNPKYILFKFSLLLLFLQSIFAWFLWGNFTAVFVHIFPILAAFLWFFNFKGMLNKSIFNFRKSNAICVILIMIIELYFVRELKITSFILALCRITVISIVLLLNDQIKIDLFRFFTKAFAILLLVSLFGWILFLLGVSLPYTFIEGTDATAGVSYYNYYFFLLMDWPLSIFIPRFSSVFLEPGYLGLISIFLLIGNRFELKRKSVLIIFLAIIFSFSLAAYVVLFITILMFLTFISKRFIPYLLLISLLVLSLYYINLNWIAGENPVNHYILQRLEYDDGRISGWNRFSSDLDSAFQNFMETDDKYFGFGGIEFRKMTWEGGNAGYKVFLLQYGIVGALFVFLFYITMVLSSNNKMVWILFIAYLLIFIQAAYPVLSCVLLVFITAVPTLKSIRGVKRRGNLLNYRMLMRLPRHPHASLGASAHHNDE